MPRFFKQDILSDPKLDPSHELESPLDTPELEAPHQRMNPDLEGDGLGLNYDPLKILLSWKAASRPFRKKDRSFYTTVFLLLILISGIAFFSGQVMLIGVFLSLGFLIYVLNFIPPEDVEYKLSNQGVTIGDHFYHWQQLDSFWFSEKDGFKILHILTLIKFPGVLMLVLGETPQEDVKRVVAKFLPYHEIAPKSQIEKWSDSLQRYFPLENPHR